MNDVDVDDNGCHEHAFAGHNLVRLAENRRPGDFHRSWAHERTIYHIPSSGIRTTPSGPCPVDAVGDLTTISILRITTISIAVKIAPWTHFSTSGTSWFIIFLTQTKFFFSDFREPLLIFTMRDTPEIVSKIIVVSRFYHILSFTWLKIANKEKIVYRHIKLFDKPLNLLLFLNKRKQAGKNNWMGLKNREIKSFRETVQKSKSPDHRCLQVLKGATDLL